MSNVSTSELEQYRHWFLSFLSTCEKIMKCNDEISVINDSLSLFETGRYFETAEIIQSQHEISIKAGRILIQRYGGELKNYSFEGIRQCYEQLQAESGVLTKILSVCWTNLVKIADELWLQCDKIWYLGDNKKHRELFLLDTLATDRIHYYKKALNINNAPVAPRELESDFRMHYDGIIYLVPFTFEDY